MIAGIWMEKKNCQMHGQASQDSFYWAKCLLTDTHGMGRDLQGNKEPLVQTMYGEICGRMCLMQKKKESKQKWAIETPKLDNARQLRGIFFIEPNDEEFKLTMKAARRKFEVPMPAAMPCKIPIESSRETHRNLGETQDEIRLCCWCRRKHQTKARRSWTQTSFKITSLQKGRILLLIAVLFTSSFRCLKHSKIPDAMAAVEKEWENTGMAADKRQKQKRGDRRSKG